MSESERAQVPKRQQVLKQLRQDILRRAPQEKACLRLPTGIDVIDHALGGGLFAGALNEIHTPKPGGGAWEILLPILARLARKEDPPRLLTWVTTKNPPYPPTLLDAGFDLQHCLALRPRSREDLLWAAEQTLLSELCGTLVLSLDEASGDIPERSLRRLQLAAERARAVCLLWRPLAAASRASPAALRLELTPSQTPDARRRRVILEILRCRGEPPRAPIVLEWNVDPLVEPLHARVLHRATSFGEGRKGIRYAGDSYARASGTHGA